MYINSLYPKIDRSVVYPLGLRYPFIFVSDRVLICMSAKNIAALLQLLIALFLSDLILLSKVIFSTYSQLNLTRNAKEKGRNLRG